MYQAGTIERGHIYFFYRPKVELEEAHSLDDIQRFYMLLVPRPPQFAAHSDSANSKGDDEDQEMNLIESGADAVPAPEPKNQSKKRFRLLVIGKKASPGASCKGRAFILSPTGRRLRTCALILLSFPFPEPPSTAKMPGSCFLSRFLSQAMTEAG
ncbi:hypothetical protein NUW54_g14389 [Trametes sanguinea]|uniref:Uncharacterized protein n=1 Tax=Trametes sanguinea TaxID=158606 RepID=A0ACC1MCH2_9APHY|nr:hypothetical protein NUW54_g14389 [Trametes sanguinea]